jgi:hypothetical protein
VITTSTGLPARDVKIVREVASKVAEVGALSVQQETIKLWEDLNGLRPQRPMAMIDELPWHEMNVDDELTLRSTDPFCRSLEETLRQTLYAWNHMRCDMVVEPYVDIPKVIIHDGYGVGVVEDILQLDPGNTIGRMPPTIRMPPRPVSSWRAGVPTAIVSHAYKDAIPSAAELEQIRAPHISLDVEATAAAGAMAHECLDGLLDVRMQGMNPFFAPWDDIVELRGAEAVLLDLADRPDFMGEIANRLTVARLAEIDTLEELGLMGYGLDRVHCCGAHTDELPAPGFDPAKPRAKDNWIFGMAQILLSVSNEMFEEFEIPNAIRYFSRWGLGYYGCCDPLHDRVQYIRKIPGIRKISMSPWVNVEKGAEQIGRDFVFSRKPNPAMVAMDEWHPAAAEKDIRETLDACVRNNCPVEITLKDISTVRYQPQRLWEWSEIVARAVRG